MPMKAHCDKCDALCEEYRKWVELTNFEGNPLILHIQVGNENNMFCRRCWVTTLETVIAVAQGIDPDIPF